MPICVNQMGNIVNKISIWLNVIILIVFKVYIIEITKYSIQLANITFNFTFYTLVGL